MMRARVILLVGGAAALVAPAGSALATPPTEIAAPGVLSAPVAPGKIATDLVSGTDPEQQYAVYVPTAYTGEEAVPVGQEI